MTDLLAMYVPVVEIRQIEASQVGVGTSGVLVFVFSRCNCKNSGQDDAISQQCTLR